MTQRVNGDYGQGSLYSNIQVSSPKTALSVMGEEERLTTLAKL